MVPKRQLNIHTQNGEKKKNNFIVVPKKQDFLIWLQTENSSVVTTQIMHFIYFNVNFIWEVFKMINKTSTEILFKWPRENG